jgi:hypothetical protein
VEKLRMRFILLKKIKLNKAIGEKFLSYNGTQIIVIITQGLDEINRKKRDWGRRWWINCILKVKAKFTVKKGKY